MEHYAGIDVALEQSSLCVVDGTGRIVREAKVASEPEALARFLGQLGLVVTRIGVEAGPLSQWLHAGLTKAGLEVVLLETRQVKATLSAMVGLQSGDVRDGGAWGARSGLGDGRTGSVGARCPTGCCR
jgi:transposase